MTLLAIASSPTAASSGLYISDLLRGNQQQLIVADMRGTVSTLVSGVLRSGGNPTTWNISVGWTSWTSLRLVTVGVGGIPPFWKNLKCADLSFSRGFPKSSFSTTRNYSINDGKKIQKDGMTTVSLYGHQFPDRRIDSTSDFPRPQEIPWQKNLVNSVNLIGLLGKDPEIKYFDTGRICARSSLAVRKSSNPDDSPSWFMLEFWNELAEIAAHHLKKGNRIHVAGRVVVDIVEGDDQVSRTYVKVIVSNLNYIDLPKESVPKLMGSEEKKSAAEKLWQEYFSSPGEWWDNRNKKKNPKSPDFKHKTSGEALWVESWNTPSWVNSQLQTLDSKAAYGRDQRMRDPNYDRSSFSNRDFPGF